MKKDGLFYSNCFLIGSIQNFCYRYDQIVATWYKLFVYNISKALVRLIRAHLTSPQPRMSHSNPRSALFISNQLWFSPGPLAIWVITPTQINSGCHLLAFMDKDSISHNHLHTNTHKHRCTYRIVDIEAQWSCSRDYDWQKEICERDWCSVS